jgi:hypothetical protein
MDADNPFLAFNDAPTTRVLLAASLWRSSYDLPTVFDTVRQQNYLMEQCSIWKEVSTSLTKKTA